jgi:16S rRNA (guanine(527)-N(7))-methyltransferase RsmG
VQDSLAIADYMPDRPTHAIDIGTGGGFPGLVLAIATGVHFHLVESDQRKCAFLREAARVTATGVTLHPCRIEDARIPPAPVITARALAPLPRLLGWATPHLAEGGVCLFPKGRTVDDELASAAPIWRMRIERFPSTVDPTSTILRLSEICRAPQ